jgi:hypothetical protein
VKNTQILSEGEHSWFELQRLIKLIPLSIIAAEGAIANVVGMTEMQPPVKDLRKLPIHASRMLLMFPFSSSYDANSTKSSREGARSIYQFDWSYWYVIDTVCMNTC